MASATSCRCLLRPTATPSLPTRLLPVYVPRVTFSSTSLLNAPAGDNSNQRHIRTGKKTKLGKFKKKVEHGKAPLPGERKAFRKRILLTNDNAVEVRGLEALTPAVMVDTASAGRMFSLSETLLDQLRAAEAFKPTQCWSLFRWPHVLLRAEAVEVARQMQDAVRQKETMRLVLTGDRISGKSMLLLQAIANAYFNDWIVINISEAQELTTACTEYGPIPGTDPVQYMQPGYALRLVQMLRKANAATLETLTVVHTHKDLPAHLPEGSSLLQLANLAKETENGWPVFQALWKELNTQGHYRRPILLALDGLSHIMKISDYRSPAYELIHSHDLALVRLFTDALAGTTPLPNGGAVIAATSRGNAPRSPSMELALDQREAIQAGQVPPQAEPYGKGYDDRVEAALRDVPVMRLQGLSKTEARALMEYWAASGLLRATIDEATVSEKWTMAGNGVVGEMERAALLNMRV